jgi:hypothetical protein
VIGAALISVSRVLAPHRPSPRSTCGSSYKHTQPTMTMPWQIQRDIARTKTDLSNAHPRCPQWMAFEAQAEF